MGDAVAVAAFLELGYHCRRMRRTMTVLTLWNHPVPGLVAEGARQGLVLGQAGVEKVEGLPVACAAVL